MRSAHIIYRALTMPAELIEGADGIMIVAPLNEFFDEFWLGVQVVFVAVFLGVALALENFPA